MKNIKVSENFKKYVRKGTCFVLSTALSCSLVGGVSATNIENPTEQVSLFALQTVSLNVQTGVNIYINDKSFTPTDANGNEVYPFLFRGTNYLPARAISNVFGSEISWDGNTGTVILNTKKMNINNTSAPRKDTRLVDKTITASKNVKMIVNGKPFIPTDAFGNIVDIYIVNGTTYLPIRAISNLYNVDIVWEGSNKAVYIGKHVKNEYTGAYPYSSNIDRNYTDALNKYVQYHQLLKVHDAEINDRLIAVVDSMAYTNGLYEVIEAKYGTDNIVKYAEPEIDKVDAIARKTLELRDVFINYTFYETRMRGIEPFYKDAMEGIEEFEPYETPLMQSWANNLEDLNNNYSQYMKKLTDSEIKNLENSLVAAINELDAKLASTHVLGTAYTLKK